MFSRSVKLEKLTWKLPDILQIQVCPNHGPPEVGWGHIGKPYFVYVDL
jgi:hypothetical protein